MKTATYSLWDFLPLIGVFALVCSLTLARQAFRGWNLPNLMPTFMGFFFIVFGSLKIINLKGFVQAYRLYDVLAQRSTLYAYLYPFIELGLGAAYLTQAAPVATNLTTLVLMSIGSIGVALELAKGKHITCACLGAIFIVPMTWVTLMEDLLMAGMALVMLFSKTIN